MKQLPILGICALCLLPFGVNAQIPQLDQFNLEALEGFSGQSGQNSNFDPLSMAQAQSSFTINTVPQYPGPDTETQVLVDAYSIDSTGATILWFVDGQEFTEARNLREATVTTKGVGENTTIRVEIRRPGGPTITETKTLRPRQVDLIIEADTVTPSFYEGRALPSVGSTVRLVAIPDNTTGQRPSDYTYIWKQNNDVLFGGPLNGRYAVDIEMGIDRNQLITVDVIDPRGGAIARKSIFVPMAEPEVLFYEDNPLRGASEQALTSPFILTKDEVTLRAEPYFMSADIFRANNLTEWELNGSTINNPSTDPQYITLQRQANLGSAQLGFHVRNLDQLLQSVEGDLLINF